MYSSFTYDILERLCTKEIKAKTAIP